MIDPESMSDGRTPASELEAKEEAKDRPAEDYSAAVGRVLSWFLEGQSLAQIGLRVLVATHKLRPDLIGGISFQQISQMAGFGRSAAHNLSTEFERNFPVRGIHDRSTLARAHYRESHQKTARGRRAGR
jgi:hypothetical protein